MTGRLPATGGVVSGTCSQVSPEGRWTERIAE